MSKFRITAFGIYHQIITDIICATNREIAIKTFHNKYNNHAHWLTLTAIEKC
jgi:hypothetical protein